MTATMVKHFYIDFKFDFELNFIIYDLNKTIYIYSIIKSNY